MQINCKQNRTELHVDTIYCTATNDQKNYSIRYWSSLGPDDHLEEIRRAHAEVIQTVIILQQGGQCAGVQDEVDQVRGAASLKYSIIMKSWQCSMDVTFSPNCLLRSMMVIILGTTLTDMPVYSLFVP